MYNSVEEIQEVNEANGFHYFKAANLLGMKAYPAVYQGKFFIMQMLDIGSTTPRTQHVVKMVRPDGSICTVSNPSAITSYEQAIDIARSLPVTALPFDDAQTV